MSENTFENTDQQDVNLVEETDLEQVERERAADEGGMVPPSVSHEAGDKLDGQEMGPDGDTMSDPAGAPMDAVTGDAAPAVDEAINVDMPEQPTRDERGEGL